MNRRLGYDQVMFSKQSSAPQRYNRSGIQHSCAQFLVFGVRATNSNEHDEVVGRPRHPSRAISITLLSPPPVNKVPGGGWNQQCCYNCLWDGDVRGYEASAMLSLLLARTSSDLTYILIIRTDSIIRTWWWHTWSKCSSKLIENWVHWRNKLHWAGVPS